MRLGRFVLRNGNTHHLVSRQPYQSSHNEEIVSHLYHAGFQTGVSSLLNNYSTFRKVYLLFFFF